MNLDLTTLCCHFFLSLTDVRHGEIVLVDSLANSTIQIKWEQDRPSGFLLRSIWTTLWHRGCSLWYCKSSPTAERGVWHVWAFWDRKASAGVSSAGGRCSETIWGLVRIPRNLMLSTPSSMFMWSSGCVALLDLLKPALTPLVFAVFRTRLLSEHHLAWCYTSFLKCVSMLLDMRHTTVESYWLPYKLLLLFLLMDNFW